MRVLSFDGGGLLGIGPATFLECWERERGHAAWAAADAFAGTSTGAILAAGLACEMSATEIVGLYRSRAKEIFRKNWWPKSLLVSKYSGEGLRKVMEETFGARTMRDAKKDLLICASDFEGDGPDGLTDFYSPSTHPDLLVSEAVMRSCSAPTYFPAVKKRWADGGLFANNPSMAMLVHLRRIGVLPDSVRMVSLATGGKFWRPEKLGSFTLSNLGPLLEFVLSAATARVVHQYAESAGCRYYCRIAPPQESPAMDDIAGMERWADVWEDAYCTYGFVHMKRLQDGS